MQSLAAGEGCGMDGADDDLEDESEYGEHGTISAGVAGKWVKRYEAAGGVGVPRGSFFSGETSDVWSGGAANRAWSPDGGKDRSGWANPARWVAGRKASERGMVPGFDGEPESGQWGGAAWEKARWPYGYGAEAEEGAIPTSRYGDRGQGTWGEFVRGVHGRYDSPTRSRYMDAMYDRLGASRSGAFERMGRAVQKLDWEANMVNSRVRRMRAVPVPVAVAREGAGGEGGGGAEGLLRGVEGMRLKRRGFGMLGEEGEAGGEKEAERGGEVTVSAGVA